jgi:hypothetical protein
MTNAIEAAPPTLTHSREASNAIKQRPEISVLNCTATGPTTDYLSIISKRAIGSSVDANIALQKLRQRSHVSEKKAPTNTNSPVSVWNTPMGQQHQTTTRIKRCAKLDRGLIRETVSTNE